MECNFIEAVDFGRKDVKIANKIYEYSKGAVMRRFKFPQKGVKIDRTTKDVTTLLPTKNTRTLQRYTHLAALDWAGYCALPEADQLV